ncbi:hypothetical protein F5141DRAFT_1109048 [Pisolithus sp. B1]|nr:hypothetical protein F5141DRAFT_1109048 [Pisolithus sp. B1]
MHRIAGILMRLQQILSNLPRRFRNIANTYWWEGVPSGSTQNDAKRPRNLRTAKRLPRSSSTRRDNEYRAEWPNHSPAPPKRPPNGIIYTPSILRDSHRRATIKMRSKNQGLWTYCSHSATLQACETPLECCKHLLVTWDTPRTNTKCRNPIII